MLSLNLPSRSIAPSRLMHGQNIYQDLCVRLPQCPIQRIFDVGANIGQSTVPFARYYPGCEIHCFEPVANTFAHLRRNLSALPNVRLWQLALGAAVGTGTMRLEGSSDLFRLVKGVEEDRARTEVVAIETIDHWCEHHAIDSISYLKIDTEGHDLEVLRGATSMLQQQRIALVEVEAGMHPHNTRHVPLEQLKAFLEQHHFYVFGIYEQIHEWTTGEPHLRRVNAVFVSQQAIASNRV